MSHGTRKLPYWEGRLGVSSKASGGPVGGALTRPAVRMAMGRTSDNVFGILALVMWLLVFYSLRT